MIRRFLSIPFAFLSLLPAAPRLSAQGDAIPDAVVRKVDASVVAIQHENAVGSGFVLTADGLILTNGHVVRGDDEEDPTRPARQIMVILNDERKFPARVLGFSMDPDVALVRIDAGEPLQPVEFADSAAARIGQNCFAVGTPVGLKRTFTSGVLSNVERTDLNTEVKVFQTDAAINPGNSGGPLFDHEGRVLGINTYASRGSNNLGFTIPSHVVLKVKDSLLRHGRLVRSVIPFVSMSEIYDELAKGLGVSEGVLVEHVEKGSAADRAGLHPGDIVTRIDGNSVTARNRAQFLDLDWSITTRTPGEAITLTVRPDGGGEPREVRLTLEEMEPLPRFGHHAGELVEFRLDALGLGVRRLVLLQRLIGNLGDDAGVIVSTVAKSSAADNAGLAEEDVITRVAGVPTPDLASFQRVLAEKLAAHPEIIELGVARGRQSFDTALRPDYDLRGLTVGAHFGAARPEFADLMRLELVASGCDWTELSAGAAPDIVLLASQPGSAPEAPAFAEILRQAVASNRVVAASGPAVTHLLAAGADLKERKITVSKESTDQIKPGQVQYTGQEVEEDGKLVTSTGRDRKVVREFLRAIRKAAADAG